MAVLGIDLGTTNTVVGVVQNGQATAIRDPDGEYLIPSVVSFHQNGSVLVGRQGKDRRVVDATNTVYSIKRLIGRSWGSEEVARARKRFPFEMREGPGQAALVVARGETFTLPEISAFVLRHARSLAEKMLGEPAERAVITVPANFNDLQRAATKVAGRVAGLEVLRILNEPTAAALAYGYGKGKGERIAIYDFGGGTFDVTLLDLSGNVFEVLATAGNTFLGGDDIDLAIAERMADAVKAQHGVDARADPQVFERLRYYAEKLKVDLSTQDLAQIDVPDVGRGAGGKQLRLTFPLSRPELEALAKPIVEKTFETCSEALGIARLDPQVFDQVVLVGGSTRLPIVRSRVQEYFGRAPLDRINPDEVVAIGAAIQANALTGAERRRSVIPKPPMPAARSLEESVATTLPRGAAKKSVPPPHPNLRKGTKTDPFGKRPEGLAGPSARTDASVPLPGQRRRVITGMGLGPAKAPPAPSPEEKRPPPPKKGGTLGGVAPPPATEVRAASTSPSTTEAKTAVTNPPAVEAGNEGRERISSIDGDWDAPRRSSRPPIELDAEDDEPTNVFASNRPAPRSSAPAGRGSSPGRVSSLPPLAPATFTEDEPTQVGTPAELLASTRALATPAAAVDSDAVGTMPSFDPPTPLEPISLDPSAPLATMPSFEPPTPIEPITDVDPPRELPLYGAPRTDEAPPEKPPPIRRGFQKTMLGGAGAVPPRSAPAEAPPLPASAPHSPPLSTTAKISSRQAFDRTAISEAAPFVSERPAARALEVSVPEPARPQLPLLVDVTPLSLCVETVGGYRDVLIARNTPVPCEQSRSFVTSRDFQQSVRVRVGQGEAERFAENVVLGELELSGLRAAPRGETHFVVTFTLDTDGMLDVRAHDSETGNAATARLRMVGLPDQADLGKMTARHERHRAS
ncbi:MAG TPA: Hsp70 family protein [Polyangiaceae bacterium]|nr:Hsp70 family protein [Polyangiaceae bacterium]